MMITKESVNYMVIRGMRTVGHQCKDCANVVRHIHGTMGCKVINTYVKPTGHCDKFESAEEQKA